LTKNIIVSNLFKEEADSEAFEDWREKPLRILMTGATGLIGRRLCESLADEGHTIIALSRAPEKAGDLTAAELHRWDPLSGAPPAVALQGVDVVVHLAGEPIAARRWSAEQKRRIRDSRVLSTKNLVAALMSNAHAPGAFICGSAVGFYGDRGDEQLDELSRAGRGFLSEVCQEWEGEALGAQQAGGRVVLVRTGVVLSPEGGALKKMLPPFKLGIGGPLGGGRQWFPWIHIDDIVGIFRHAIFSPSLGGALNGTAPGIVTNAEFTKQLGGVLGRPAFLPVPEFALRLLMGEMADIVLASQRALPEAALEAGYKFKSPGLRAALESLWRGESADDRKEQKADLRT
jgi:uncharacterized protein (TIGR01777 family)